MNEYRLYYDDHGRVITYTTENIDGKYIVITPLQYAEARPDIVIVDGNIVETHQNTGIYTLTRNLIDGTKCSKYDINIIVDSADDGYFWKLERNEW